MNQPLTLPFKKWILSFGLICFILLGWSVPGFASKPSAVQLMQELRDKPVYEHGEIYAEILKNPSLLNHSGLVNRLLKVGREKFLENCFFAQRFARTPSEIPDWCVEKNVTNPAMSYSGILKKIPNDVQGYHALELKIVFASHAPGWDNELLTQIKRDPNTLRVLVREETKIQYKNRDIPKNVLISGMMGVGQALYESYKFNENQISSALHKKVIEWAEKMIKEPRFTLKRPAIAILFENSWNAKQVKKHYKYDIEHNMGDTAWTLEELCQVDIIRAKQMRKKYPKWPINQESPTDPHKNQTGEGHDKQRGEGHK